jgi:hypothetical protein
MRQALKLHPDSRCDVVAGVEVEAARRPGGRLSLRFRVPHPTAGLALPAPAASERTDGLWRHTCFEAFLRAPAGEAYVEINLSPSTRWAAYRFDGYRQGTAALDMAAAPTLDFGPVADGYELVADLDLSGVADLPVERPWRVGLSAVIEDARGGIAYWALAHPPGKPDFHHADCFILDLAPTDLP